MDNNTTNKLDKKLSDLQLWFLFFEDSHWISDTLCEPHIVAPDKKRDRDEWLALYEKLQNKKPECVLSWDMEFPKEGSRFGCAIVTFQDNPDGRRVYERLIRISNAQLDFMDKYYDSGQVLTEEEYGFEMEDYFSSKRYDRHMAKPEEEQEMKTSLTFEDGSPVPFVEMDNFYHRSLVCLHVALIEKCYGGSFLDYLRPGLDYLCSFDSTHADFGEQENGAMLDIAQGMKDIPNIVKDIEIIKEFVSPDRGPLIMHEAEKSSEFLNNYMAEKRAEKAAKRAAREKAEKEKAERRAAREAKKAAKEAEKNKKE